MGILGRLISEVHNNFRFGLGGGDILGKEVPKQFQITVYHYRFGANLGFWTFFANWVKLVHHR